MTRFEIRRLESVDAPLMSLPYPILNPLALELVAQRLDRTSEQIGDLRGGVGFVAIPPVPGVPVWSHNASSFEEDARILQNSLGLRAAVERSAPDLLADDSSVWPFLTTLPILDAPLRTRWHGLNYLYARVSHWSERVRLRLSHGYAPPGERGNLEHEIEHLFFNGRRGVTSVATLEGEEATLNQAESPYDPPCTSLMDILRTFVPTLDPTAVLARFDGTMCEIENEDIVVPTLRAIGLRAIPV